MTDYDRVAKTIEYLNHHYLDQPRLSTLAKEAGLSEFHFHRLFTRWAGVTPKDFLQFCTAAHAKELLRRSKASVLESAMESGLSGPGRLHDLLVSLEGVTPGEYKARGEGLEIRYGAHPTPFGKALIGLSKRGISFFAFLPQDTRQAEKNALKDLTRTWPKAQLTRDLSLTQKTMAALFAKKAGTFPVYSIGTPFQLKVWEAALKIPAGHVLSYEEVAARAGNPKAARAVGSALARNPVCYLIPCHRVIRQTGVIGEYRGGRLRKQALLAWEYGRT